MYVCKKMKLCSFLLKKGFVYVKTEPHKYRKNCIVWLFPSSPELNLAIEEYYSLMPIQ